MKTKLLATVLGMTLVAATSAFAQRFSVGVGIGQPGYYPPAGAYGAPCGPGYVWIPGYNDINGYWVEGYCAVPPYGDAYWVAPGYFGGRWIGGYWSHGGYGFRGGWDRDDFRFRGGDRDDFRFRGGFREGGAFRGGDRGDSRFREGFSNGFGSPRVAPNNFRGGAQGGQGFAGSNNFRGGNPGGNFRGRSPNSNFRGGAQNFHGGGGAHGNGGGFSGHGGDHGGRR